MFDYVFYSETSRNHFCRWLEAHEVEWVLASGSQEEKLVRIPEHVADELLDEIDTRYDALLAADEALLMAQDGAAAIHIAGISFRLTDGRSIQLPVDPDLLNRLLATIDMQELGAFVQQIVAAVENPDERPFCQQSRAHE